jgi:hypothetical protein
MAPLCLARGRSKCQDKDKWNEVVLVGVLRRFDRGVVPRCQQRRGGVAAYRGTSGTMVLCHIGSYAIHNN